jgi:hypothetical protein
MNGGGSTTIRRKMADALPIISQLTPYTCALACLESFLQQLGVRATQADMLTHHRALCSNPGACFSTFGAIDVPRFIDLATRYTLGAIEFPSRDVGEIRTQLNKPREMLTAICGKFQGQQICHAIRLSHFDGDVLHFMCPQFPVGTSGSVPFVELRDSWQAVIIRVFAQ